MLLSRYFFFISLSYFSIYIKINNIFEIFTGQFYKYFKVVSTCLTVEFSLRSFRAGKLAFSCGIYGIVRPWSVVSDGAQFGGA